MTADTAVPRRHGFLVLSLFALALLASPARAADAPPGFVAHFPKAYANVIAFPDPLPHLRALLTDPGLRKVLTEGKFAKALAADPGPGPKTLDPAVGWDFVSKNRTWVPREIAVGVPASALADTDAIARTALLAGLLQGARAAGDEGKKDVPKLQDLVLAELKRLRVPGVRIFARMRAADDAQGLMFLLQEQLKQAQAGQAIPPGIVLKAQEDSISVRAKLGDFLEPGFLAGLLDAFGFIAGEDDPKAKAMSDIVAGLSVELTLARADDALVLTLGPSPAGDGAAARTPADLGPVFDFSPATILWAGWDVGPLRDAAAGWTKLWDQYAGTPTGKATEEIDEEGLIGTLQVVVRELERLAPRGSMRAWTEPGKGIRLETRETGGPALPALAGSPVAQFVPADAEAFDLDASASLGELLTGILVQFEDQVAKQTLKAELRGKEDDALTKVEDAYYEHFHEFRKLMIEEMDAPFEVPVGWLIGTRGRVSKFHLKVAVAGEKPMDVKAADLPMMEFAAVGRPAKGKDAAAALEKAYAAFVTGVYKAAGAEAPRDVKAVERRDLGLGVPTFVLSGKWVADLGAKNNVTLVAEGDLLPHYFVAHECVVFSTSPALSRRMIAAAAGKAPAHALPQAGAGAKLVAYGRFPGRVIGQYARHLGAWMTPLMGAAGDGAGRASFADITDGIAEVAELLEMIEWESVQQGDRTVTRGAVTFGAGK